MKAMILAAGMGTRLSPLTDTKPKALIEVHGKPLLEIVIKRLISSGFKEVVVNVHHFADQIIEFLKKNHNFNIDIIISDERNQLLDTGGGLKKAAHLLGDRPFLVHNVDVISDLDLKALYHHHINERALATLAVKNRKTSRYFLFDDHFNMLGWKNMKTNEIKMSKLLYGKFIALAFSGIHVISPEIFPLLKQEGKFSITETYLELSAHHKIIGYQCEESFWMDLGNLQNLATAEDFFHTWSMEQLFGAGSKD